MNKYRFIGLLVFGLLAYSFVKSSEYYLKLFNDFEYLKIGFQVLFLLVSVEMIITAELPYIFSKDQTLRKDVLISLDERNKDATLTKYYLKLIINLLIFLVLLIIFFGGIYLIKLKYLTN